MNGYGMGHVTAAQCGHLPKFRTNFASLVGLAANRTGFGNIPAIDPAPKKESL